jgi:hypothetical protein
MSDYRKKILSLGKYFVAHALYATLSKYLSVRKGGDTILKILDEKGGLSFSAMAHKIVENNESKRGPKRRVTKKGAMRQSKRLQKDAKTLIMGIRDGLCDDWELFFTRHKKKDEDVNSFVKSARAGKMHWNCFYKVKKRQLKQLDKVLKEIALVHL